MWATAKLKAAITEDDTYFALADGIGFEQAMVGDIIVMDRVRLPEYMLVTGFDENNKLIQVQRGYRGTDPCAWKKGNKLRIFRMMNVPARKQMDYEDYDNPDGTTDRDMLVKSSLVYDWQPEDTCLPGCYWLEFIVMKMQATAFFLPGGYWTGQTHQYNDGYYYTGSDHTDSSVRLSYDQVQNRYLLPELMVWAGETHITGSNYFTGSNEDDGGVILTKTGVPLNANIAYDETGQLGALSISDISFTNPSLTSGDFGCGPGEGIEWVRKFPVVEPLLIQIIDSPATV